MGRHFSHAALVLYVMILAGCDSKPDDFVDPTPTEVDNLFVINDTFKGEPVVIFSHKSFNIFTAYSRRLEDGTVLEFIKITNCRALLNWKTRKGIAGIIQAKQFQVTGPARR